MATLKQSSFGLQRSRFKPLGEANRYQVDQFRYPLNLMGDDNEFNGNKVLFFINVAEASRYSGTVEGKGVKKEFEMWDIPEGDVVKNSGKEVAASVDPGTLTASAMKRLSAAIALYMPNSITQGTSVSWSEEDFTTDASTAFLEAAAKPSSAAESLTSGAMAKIVGGSSRVQNATRITPGNSKAEMLFKSVDFRSFDFSYAFSPKSEKEADNVMNIIRMFKHHMLPEFKDEAKFLYIYPSEFNIKYYKGSDENKFIEKQMTAVLTRVNVDYTPNGQFNTFANGMPTQINLTLSFRELSVPTKETSPYDAHGV